MKTSISVKIFILCPPVQRLFIYFYSLLNICMFRFVNNEAVSQHLPTGTRGLVWIYRQSNFIAGWLQINKCPISLHQGFTAFKFKVGFRKRRKACFSYLLLFLKILVSLSLLSYGHFYFMPLKLSIKQKEVMALLLEHHRDSRRNTSLSWNYSPVWTDSSL